MKRNNETVGGRTEAYQDPRRQAMRLQHWCMMETLSLGAIIAAGDRSVVDPDTLSYLDMAEEAVSGNAYELVNGLWSPLYPTLIAFTLFLLHPSREFVIPTLHILQWLILAAATFSFQYFLRCWIELHSAETQSAVTQQPAFTLFAYAIYAWVALRLISVSYPTPDMCVAVILLVALALFCRTLNESSAGWLHSAMLGFILGAGYLAKSAMLPIGLALLLLVLICSRQRLQASLRFYVALVAMGIVIAPFILLLSKREGHTSVGEAARLNYAWHVRLLPFPWTGDVDANGRAEHPVRIINSDPLSFEFGAPVKGTFPLWYDPAYWHSGLKPVVRLNELAKGIAHRMAEFDRHIIEMIPIAAGAILLFTTSGTRLLKHRPVSRTALALGGWAFVSVLLFLPFHVEYRYIGVLILVLTMCTYTLASVPAPPRTARVVMQVVACCMLLVMMMLTVRGAARLLTAEQPEHMAIAEELRKLGAAPGDSMAVAGYPFDAFYAYLLRTRVTVLVCDSTTFHDVDWKDPFSNCRNEQFFHADRTSDQRFLSELKSAKVKFIVGRDRPEWLPANGWRRLGKTRYSAFSLDDNLRLSQTPN